MASVDNGGFRWSGLVVAGIGFAVSRGAVASTVTMRESLGLFLLTDGVPMVAAFGLVVFGIGLTVSSLSHDYVRTVSIWCVVGTGSMLAIVVLAALDTGTFGQMGGIFDRSVGPFATNSVLGGSLGGTLTGIYAARAKRRTRQAAGQADRLHLLNRLLRDEVLNAITVVLGHAEVLTGRNDASDHADPIKRNAEHIQGVIDDVGTLTDDSDQVLEAFVVTDVLDEEVSKLRTEYPDASITVESGNDACVRADDQFPLLLEQLLSNAVEHNHSSSPSVDVAVDQTTSAVEIAITDNGPGLEDSERALLESGSLDRYDTPSEGFGLWITRILLDRYDGTARITVDGGTTVTVVLPRADVDERGPSQSNSIGVSPRQLGNASVSGLFAGVAMGLLFQVTGETIPIIGALYGVTTISVGWVTHLFHSVVFATTFAAMLSHPRMHTVREQLNRALLVAVALGLVLWFGAAGIVMPLWLRLVGVDAPLPQLQMPSLVGHLLWATVLAASYWALRRFEI